MALNYAVNRVTNSGAVTQALLAIRRAQASRLRLFPRPQSSQVANEHRLQPKAPAALAPNRRAGLSSEP